ncbi:MAG: SpoIIE family protein phosphatase [Desulfobacterales bacterium]
MKTKSRALQRKLILFVLLPVGSLLLGLGGAGFIYTRNMLLRQWGEATTLKLQRAAHLLDMELNRPKSMVAMLIRGDIWRHHGYGFLEELILAEMVSLNGVLSARVSQVPTPSPLFEAGANTEDHAMRTMAKPIRSATNALHGHHRHHSVSRVRVSPPRYDDTLQSQTTTLMWVLRGASGEPMGEVELILSFDHLVDLIAEAEWWRQQEALLVDTAGKILAGTWAGEIQDVSAGTTILPEALLTAMAGRYAGTTRIRETGEDRISGFYRLVEAPWVLVVSAPAWEVLAPIRRFSIVYLALGGSIIIGVLLLIRLTTAKTVTSIQAVSQAAEQVAAGDYNIHLPVTSNDEIGELTRRFNTMARQLEEGALMKRSLLLAQEVQQSLLPTGRLTTRHLDVAGASRYCDETGGDYYDYIPIPRPERGAEPYAVVVGDVTGHGIAAALLMATVRSLLRLRVALGGRLEQIMTDVNRLLCADTVESGSFITLFLLSFDPLSRGLTWVRAGHEPALIYDPQTNDFTELAEPGIALGVDAEWRYRQHEHQPWQEHQLLLIGTDGIWEAENQSGERFGKERLREIIRQHADAPVDELLNAVMDAVDRFRGGCRQADDTTLVVMKQRLSSDRIVK